MKSSFGRVLFLVIASCLLSERCRADAALDLAAALLRAGNCFEAVTECKRFICFNQGDSCLPDAYLLMGQAYKTDEKWDLAIEAFSHSIRLTSDDSLKAERRIDLAITRLMRGDNSGAEYDLLRVTAFENRVAVKRKAALFLGVCRTIKHEWSGARAAFGESVLKCGDSLPSDLDSILAVRAQPRVRSERTARWLSAFVPGSGQIYGGDIGAGVNALSINSAFGYLLVRSLLDRRYDDAIIGYMTLFIRYYSGNLYHATQAVHDHNARLNKRYVDQLLAIVRAEVENTETSSQKPGP